MADAFLLNLCNWNDTTATRGSNCASICEMNAKYVSACVTSYNFDTNLTDYALWCQLHRTPVSCFGGTIVIFCRNFCLSFSVKTDLTYLIRMYDHNIYQEENINHVTRRYSNDIWWQLMSSWLVPKIRYFIGAMIFR